MDMGKSKAFLAYEYEKRWFARSSTDLERELTCSCEDPRLSRNDQEDDQCYCLKRLQLEELLISEGMFLKEHLNLKSCLNVA